MDKHNILPVVRDAWERVNLGDLTEARSILSNALQLAPESEEVILEIAKLEMFTGDIQGALDRLNGLRPKSHYPGLVDLMISYGTYYVADKQDAIQIADRIIAQYPEHEDDFLNSQARLYRAFFKGDWQYLIQEFGTVKSLPDYDLTLASFLIAALMTTGKYEEARGQLRSYVRVFPASWWAHSTLGLAELYLGNKEVAYQAFLEAHARAPDNTDVLAYLINTAFRLRRWRSAFRYITVALKTILTSKEQ